MKRREPPFNSSREARVLREAAIEFGRHVSDEPNDYEDKAGMRRNEALLGAALLYAFKVNRRPRTPEEITTAKGGAK